MRKYNETVIMVTFDFTHNDNKSYVEVAEALLDPKISLIWTTCLEFFDTGYPHSIACKVDGSHIVSHELLKGDIFYHTDKQIREAHNLPKLLRCYKFNWRPTYKEYSVITMVNGFLMTIRPGPVGTVSHPLDPERMNRQTRVFFGLPAEVVDTFEEDILTGDDVIIGSKSLVDAEGNVLESWNTVMEGDHVDN